MVDDDVWHSINKCSGGICLAEVAPVALDSRSVRNQIAGLNRGQNERLVKDGCTLDGKRSSTSTKGEIPMTLNPSDHPSPSYPRPVRIPHQAPLPHHLHHLPTSHTPYPAPHPRAPPRGPPHRSPADSAPTPAASALAPTHRHQPHPAAAPCAAAPPR